MRTKKAKRTTKKRSNSRKQTGGKCALLVTHNYAEVMPFIRNYTYPLKEEVCGSIHTVKPRQTGEKFTFTVYRHDAPFHHRNKRYITQRHSCRHEDYKDKQIWHNHPNTSKFYPSREDIIKPLKERPGTGINITNNYIFCQFGVWEIRAKQYIPISDKTEGAIQKILNRLYERTKRTNGEKKWHVFDQAAVNIMIEELQKHPALKRTILIDFTPMPEPEPENYIQHDPCLPENNKDTTNGSVFPKFVPLE
jgi:hypothetical protein